MHIIERHTIDDILQACKFHTSVVLPVAIPFVDHIVVLCIQPTRDFRMPAKFIHHNMIIPAPVDITGAAVVSPHIATFAIEHRHIGLGIALCKVPLRPYESLVSHIVKKSFPFIAWQVGMPGIYICDYMVIIAL